MVDLRVAQQEQEGQVYQAQQDEYSRRQAGNLRGRYCLDIRKNIASSTTARPM